MAKGIYIVGTDTDVGKTIVSAGLLYLMRSTGLNTAYFKAALSGAITDGDNLIPGDTRFVLQVSDLTESYSNITPYIYKHAVSPLLASKLENNPIQVEVIKDKLHQLKQKYDYIIAEGSGGIVCPLIENGQNIYSLCDLIKELDMDVLVVAKASLGTINHTAITVDFIKNQGIPIKGIIINGYQKESVSQQDNIAMIQKMTGEPILGTLPWIEGLDVNTLNFKSLKEDIKHSIHLEKLLPCFKEI
jgi:dethiobiotin synthetase